MTYSIDDIRSKVSALAKEYGAQRVWLFGSYARGEARDGSDIDLRIEKGNIRGWKLGGLLADLEEAFGIPVDLCTTASLDERFLEAIRNEEVLLYEAS